MILMNDFKREYQTVRDDVRAVIDDCLDSGWYILGKKTAQFEQQFAEYIGSKYCIGVANGLEALQISLMALDIGEGDEVLTVSNSAVATTLAITHIGATPVFIDIDDYYHMNVTLIEKMITPKTKAIIPVHLFGQCADITQILTLAQKHNLAVIEDACQAHGAAVKGQMAGSFGEFGCFSFYPTKNLGAYGDGGAIITDSVELYDKCCKLRNYGQTTRYYHDLQGMNSRLDELQAAVLSYKLGKLPNSIERRVKIAELYQRELRDCAEIELPKVRVDSKHAYHLFVIKVKDRQELQAFLKQNGVESLIHYPIPIHKQACYPDFNHLSLPKTEIAADQVLSLPINPFLSDEEVLEVCTAIKRFYKV